MKVKNKPGKSILYTCAIEYNVLLEYNRNVTCAI